MAEECLICGAPLVYLDREEPMVCAVCGRELRSRSRCVRGHYVCDECHTRGMDAAVGLCLAETSRDPVAILERLMSQPFCHMHGPEHHVLVGAALLTACHNTGGLPELEEALREMHQRGSQVPGGACGFWGACGAGISAGTAVAILSGSTPLAERAFGLANRMTAAALECIGAVGGPRCCKRDSYLSLLAAVDFIRAHFGLPLERTEPVCSRCAQNAQCIGRRCPFSPAGRRA
ncbi:MAG: SAM-dependent methyltransferase [Ruminococcaceae bacterium]|jgi:hypothetical protein|nr:SAM-dependent methyltransferase [Oscillospiraceae bacterium]